MVNNKKIHIGIDVSKKNLDVYILPSKKYMSFLNNEGGIKKLISKLSLFPEALILLESTGGYERNLSISCAQANLKVCVMNPRQIRDFAKALGKLAKTDKIDSKIIALYAEKFEPEPNVVFDEEHQKISEQSARRHQLVNMITMEKNRLDKASSSQKKSIQRILRALEKELKAVDKEQEAAINSSKELSQKKEILKSAKGIGDVSAANLIASLPEIGGLSRKQIAALAGLAPFNRDSGTFKGKRTIWGGRENVRNALYMPTLVAIKHNPKIREFYLRLCSHGKEKMVAITACMRKFICILNAMVKKQQTWQRVAV